MEMEIPLITITIYGPNRDAVSTMKIKESARRHRAKALITFHDMIARFPGVAIRLDSDSHGSLYINTDRDLIGNFQIKKLEVPCDVR